MGVYLDDVGQHFWVETQLVGMASVFNNPQIMEDARLNAGPSSDWSFLTSNLITNCVASSTDV